MIAGPEVKGHCPVCGASELFLCHGKVVCANTSCSRPTAAHELLQDDETGHIMSVGPREFTLRHPIRERLDDALMNCQLHQHMTEFIVSYLDEGSMAAGQTYRVYGSGDGEDFAWEWEPVTTGIQEA